MTPDVLAHESPIQAQSVLLLQSNQSNTTTSFNYMLSTLSIITRSLQCGETIVIRKSDCADYIVTNLFSGYVRVMFSNGKGYTYRARKRDILKLMVDNTVSLGFWINSCLNLNAPLTQYV